MTAGPAGTPLLFASVNEDNGAASIVVESWDDGGWKRLGDPVNASHEPFMHVDDPDIVASKSGAVFLVGSEELHVHPKGVVVAKWTGKTWSFLGGSLDDDTEQYYVAPRLALDAQGAPWVAWRPTLRRATFIRVARWTGDHWERVGEERLSKLTHDARGNPQLGIAPDGSAWLAWTGNGPGAGLNLAHFDGRDWSTEPIPPLARDAQVAEVRMALSADGRPVLAWTQSDGQKNVHLEVAELEAPGWVQLVSGFHQVEGFSAVDDPALATVGNDIWVAFDEPDSKNRRTRLIRFYACAKGEAPAALPKEIDESTTWPRTIDEAVNRLMKDVDASSKARIKAMKESDLVRLHPFFGMGIRNQFGMWRGNEALLESCGGGKVVHPDDCSMAIIKAFWQRLNATGG